MGSKRISALVLDIDGVITDGTVAIDQGERESKSLSYRDVDAVFRARRDGLQIALATGEDSAFVDLIARRLAIEIVISGAKDKLAALEEAASRMGLEPEEICYVGDSDRDAPAISASGLGLTPADASAVAREASARVLSAPGGRGAVAEAVELIRQLNSSPPARDSAIQEGSGDSAGFGEQIAASLNESASVKIAAAEALPAKASIVAQYMVEALGNGGKLLIFGNGGSAADAQHFAGELVGRFHMERDAWPAIALTTDSSILTALGNDFGFDSVFARQVEALGQPGDLAIGLSTSGNSPNVIEGARAAAARGMRVVAFTGRGGGKLAGICDLTLKAPSDSTPRIQECHIAIIHALCEVVEGALVARK